VAVVNRSRSLTRALENRPQGMAPSRARRSAALYPAVTVVDALPSGGEGATHQPFGSGASASFRDRLNQIDMR
jgi:hypothetical protein